MAIILPLTSELWERKKTPSIAAGMNLVYKYSFVVVLPAVFLMVSFPDLIIKILFSAKYVEASSALIILAIGTIFMTLVRINFGLLAGIGPVLHRPLDRTRKNYISDEVV